MSEVPYPEDRKALIAKILQYQDLDSLLRLSVVLCDLELKGDGCSLFIRQDGSKDLELKESTVLSRFLGQPSRQDLKYDRAKAEHVKKLLGVHGKKPDEFNGVLTEEQVKTLDPDLFKHIHKFGLTRWAVQFRCPLVIENIHEDIRWSSFGNSTTEQYSDHDGRQVPLQHCELTPDEIGSAVFIAFGSENEDLSRGVLRVARRTTKEGFRQQDLDWLTWFAGEVERCMDVAVSLTDLMDMGAKLEIGDFGESLVSLLKRVLNVQGCSIFLELQRSTTKDVRSFQCIATTGLYSEGDKISKEEARYRVDMRREEVDSLTGWVIRNGQLLSRSPAEEIDPSRFPGLKRRPGAGTYKEIKWDPDHEAGGPLLICPLFLHQGREVAGAIRVVRPLEQGKNFEDHEQLLFLDISRRLSRVLTNINLRKVSEELIKLYDKPADMLRRVPVEVCRILGVEGCSVLQLRDRRYLELVATRGNLEGEEGKIIYDITDPKRRGWTGWVAHNRKAIRINAPAEAEEIDPPPEHPTFYSEKPCETAQRAYRFLAVPIFRKPGDSASEVLGVIRTPRNKEDPLFEEVHKSILVSFAARLSVALNIARRNESLQGVAKLASLVDILGEGKAADAPQNPENIAKEVATRAANILIDQIGMAYGAIYELEHRTNILHLLDGRSALEPDPDGIPSKIAWNQDPDFFEEPIHLGATNLNLGVIRYFTYDKQQPTERQRSLLELLAGVCANVLYNKAVFEKLRSIRQGLVRVGNEMTSDSSLTNKLEVIADVAAKVTLADNVIIHEYLAPLTEEDGAVGRFRESACGGPVTPREWKTDFKPGAIPYKIVALKEPLFEQVAKNSQVAYSHKEESNFIVREEISSVAALPLDVSETCVGCIFFNFRTEQGFLAQQQEEIQMMAEYAAMAIYQGRLLDGTQRLVDETQKLVKEKSDLLQYAEHSLNQPLSALVGYLSNLAAGIYAGSGARAQQYYMLSKYITYVVDTFLHINRVETGHLFEIQKCSCDLSNVCRHATDVAEAHMSCSIEREIAPGILCHVDENAIRMALLNVLVNAGEYGDHPIRLCLSRQPGDEGWVTIAIEDSGPGVHKDLHDQVFQLGYQKDPDLPGLGIGLYLTHGYVEAHGGTVEVKKSDLGGARFEISLPLSKE